MRVRLPVFGVGCLWIALSARGVRFQDQGLDLEQLADEEAIATEVEGESKPMKVVIDNKISRDLEHVVVLHKYLGNSPPTNILAWDTVPANGVSGKQEVFTRSRTMKRDWWQVTFRFKKKPLEPCGFAGLWDGGTISADCTVLTWETGDQDALRVAGNKLSVTFVNQDGVEETVRGRLKAGGDKIQWTDGDIWTRRSVSEKCAFAGVWDAGTISANCSMLMGNGLEQRIAVDGSRITWLVGGGHDIHGDLIDGEIHWDDGDVWVRSSKDLGEYVVEVDGLEVTRDMDRSSGVIRTLGKGTHVQVAEVPPQGGGSGFAWEKADVRARIVSPAGWISLTATPPSTEAFATKVQKQCPVCESEDGSCETYMSHSSAQVFQAVMDPRMYIRAAIYSGAAVAGVAISAASWGTLATVGANIGVGIAQGILDGVNMGFLEDMDTTEYFACSIGNDALEGSINSGRPLHLVLSEQISDEGIPAITLGFEFETENAGEITRYQKCTVGMAQLPCEAKLNDEEKKNETKHVAMTVKNNGPSKITRMAVVHKYAPIGPHLLEWTPETRDGPIASGETSSAKYVQTMTNAGIRTIGKSDWWIAAWQDEDDECLVKSSLDLDFIRGAFKGLYTDVFEGVAYLTADILTGLIPPAVGTTLSVLLNSHLAMVSRRDAIVDKTAHDLFGNDLLNTLSKTKQDKNGFFTRCNLKETDVNNTASGKPLTIEIDRRTEKVIFKFASHECYGHIVALRCLATEACAQREDCQKLAAGGMANAPAPKGLNAHDVVGGIATTATDLTGNVIRSDGSN